MLLYAEHGGAAGQEEKEKTSEEVHGCSEGEHTQGWCDRTLGIRYNGGKFILFIIYLTRLLHEYIALK